MALPSVRRSQAAKGRGGAWLSWRLCLSLAAGSAREEVTEICWITCWWLVYQCPEREPTVLCVHAEGPLVWEAVVGFGYCKDVVW